MSYYQTSIEIHEIPDYWTGLISELDSIIKEVNRRPQYIMPNTGVTLRRQDWGLKIVKELYPAIYLSIYIDADAHSVRVEGQRVDGPQNRLVSNFTNQFDLREGNERVAEYILQPILSD